MGYLCPRMLVFQCTCLKMVCNSKTTGRRVKRSEIWTLGTSRIHVGHLCCSGVFDPVDAVVSFGVIQSISFISFKIGMVDHSCNDPTAIPTVVVK